MVERAETFDLVLKNRLREICSNFSVVGEVRGTGMFYGLELVNPNRGNRPFPSAHRIAAKAVELAFENGVILYPASGFSELATGDAVIVAPPLNLSEAEMSQLLSNVHKTLQAMENSLYPKYKEDNNEA